MLTHASLASALNAFATEAQNARGSMLLACVVMIDLASYITVTFGLSGVKHTNPLMEKNYDLRDGAIARLPSRHRSWEWKASIESLYVRHCGVKRLHVG